MNEQHIELWKQTADAWDRCYQSIGDQWEAATPCEGWSVKDLVGHATGVQQQIAGGLLGVELPEGAEWSAVRDGIVDAMADPSVLDGEPSPGPFGPMPKPMMLGIATSDLLIHTWDLARAIGADETLPPEVVSAAYMGLKRFPPEAMRSEGRFAAEVAVADDADEQTKMLGFAGRQV